MLAAVEGYQLAGDGGRFEQEENGVGDFAWGGAAPEGHAFPVLLKLGDHIVVVGQGSSGRDGVDADGWREGERERLGERPQGGFAYGIRGIVRRWFLNARVEQVYDASFAMDGELAGKCL